MLLLQMLARHYLDNLYNQHRLTHVATFASSSSAFGPSNLANAAMGILEGTGKQRQRLRRPSIQQKKARVNLMHMQVLP